MRRIANTLAVLTLVGTLAVAVLYHEYQTVCPAACACGCNEGAPCRCNANRSCPVPPMLAVPRDRERERGAR